MKHCKLQTNMDKSTDVNNSNSKTEPESVDKHLTNMKELPEENYYEKGKDEVRADEIYNDNGNKVIQEDSSRPKLYHKIVVISKPIIFLGIINLIFMVALGYFLANLPKKAESLKTIRNQKLQADSDDGTELGDIEIGSVQTQVGMLEVLFPNESGLINFVREIENIKLGGVVKEFSFSSINAVTDKTGNYGIPFTIVMEGTWEQIAEELFKLQEINFLFRPVKLKTKLVPEQENVIELEYGGFLYVHESLGEN